EHVAEQKEPRHREPVGEIIRAWLTFRITEKGRQAQQLVVPRLTSAARDGTPAARRYVGELRGRASSRTTLKIEAEAKLAEQHQLKPRQRRPRPPGIDNE